MQKAWRNWFDIHHDQIWADFEFIEGDPHFSHPHVVPGPRKCAARRKKFLPRSFQGQSSLWEPLKWQSQLCKWPWQYLHIAQNQKFCLNVTSLDNSLSQICGEPCAMYSDLSAKLQRANTVNRLEPPKAVFCRVITRLKRISCFVQHFYKDGLEALVGSSKPQGPGFLPCTRQQSTPGDFDHLQWGR